MQDIVAPVYHIKFDIESSIDNQVGALPLPFPGMDKSGAAICNFFLHQMCSKGTACPYRHVKGDRSVVCKHWLRGLCKKGDDCEFLHEYDMSKMPECYFFSKFKQCSNKECPFLHIDPEKKIKDCAWYDRGFCRHGPNCKNRHVRRVVCQCFLSGFCPLGPKCKHVHPKFDLPTIDPAALTKKFMVVCHYCGEHGHKYVTCHKMPQDLKEAHHAQQQQKYHDYQDKLKQIHQNNLNARTPNFQEQFRSLDKITCFKCGEKGHYANRCTKGHLAFLSAAHHNPPDHESAAT